MERSADLIRSLAVIAGHLFTFPGTDLFCISGTEDHMIDWFYWSPWNLSSTSDPLPVGLYLGIGTNWTSLCCPLQLEKCNNYGGSDTVKPSTVMFTQGPGDVHVVPAWAQVSLSIVSWFFHHKRELSVNWCRYNELKHNICHKGSTLFLLFWPTHRLSCWGLSFWRSSKTQLLQSRNGEIWLPPS